MDGKVLKAKVYEWVEQVGPKRAKVALVNAGVGLSTAEKLAAHNYESIPRADTAFKLKRMLEEEGVLKRPASA